MQLATDLAVQVDDLLRTDPRLLAAAALVGKVAVVVTEPKPVRESKRTAKRAPPREGVAPVEPEPEQAKPTPAPWLKVAKAGKVGDAIRAAIGGQWLAIVTVDGGLWSKLRSEDQRRALVVALRGLRHEEREDGSDKVAREAPPLQCWPDTADDLSHLVAALGVDGAEGAVAVSAAESLATGALAEIVSTLTAPSEVHHHLYDGPHDRPTVDFLVDEDGELLSTRISWERGEGEDGWCVRQSGELCDDLCDLNDICQSWPDGVYLTRDHFKQGWRTSVKDVLFALRAAVGLPPQWADIDEDRDGAGDDGEVDA